MYYLIIDFFFNIIDFLFLLVSIVMPLFPLSIKQPFNRNSVVDKKNVQATTT